MACFLAPMSAAIITMAVKKKIPAKYHIDWLLFMLWGGVIMLVVDHVFSGEIVPYFPFFAAGLEQIMSEVLKVGVPMLVAVVAVWTSMVLASVLVARKQVQSSKA